MTHMRFLGFIFSVGVFALVAAGCTEPAPPPPPQTDTGRETHSINLPTIKILDLGKSSLKGKIKHKGEPIVAGRLFFMGDKGMVPTVGVIHANGTYLAQGLPEGEFCVCVLLDPEGPLPFPTLPPEPETQPPPGGPSGPMPNPRGGSPGPTPNPHGGRDGRGGIPPPLLGGLPPDVTNRLVDYTVPAGKKTLYSKLHLQYGVPGKANTLKVTVQAGENIKDLDLP